MNVVILSLHHPEKTTIHFLEGKLLEKIEFMHNVDTDRKLLEGYRIP